MISNTNFIFDAEQLSSLTSEQEYRLGLFYYKENRVFECYQNQDNLYAMVEGSNADFPYNVCISSSDKSGLDVNCDCIAESEVVCKHAVAALLFHKDEVEQEETNKNFLNLRETAIKDRIKRGQTEVKVKHQDGHPIFGLYKAQSITNNTPWARSYTVHIRSLTEKINDCNCPDLYNNQLGTCKHIEATLHHIRKSNNLKKDSVLAAPLPFIYYSWNYDNSDSPEQIKLQRTANMSEPLKQVLQPYFNAQGHFRGSLPDDFFNLQDTLYGNDQLIIGEDAIRYVQQLANKQSHLLKAQNIRTKIKQLNGNIPGVKATLYPYQIEGMSFLAANGRALLADDMGLGKTLQAISASSWLINNGSVKRVLIVCPASLKQQWAREIEKFTGLTSQIINGNAEKRYPQYNASASSNNATFFIVNYELLLRDLSVINEVLAPDLIILDEAQRIKNWRTKIASATKLISSRYAFVLTGTPLENKLEELYSLMQVVDPTILGPLWRYMSDYHVLDERGKVIGYRNLTELRKKIATVMLRRDRKIVSDQLPNRTTTQLDVPMTAKQKELHDSGLSSASQLANIAKKRALTPSEQNRMMAALQQARMACNAAGLVDKQTVGSPKLTELKNLIEELCLGEGQKIVVFSQWKGMTTMIAAILTEMNIGYVHLHGGVPSHKRGYLMDKFNQDNATKVFLSTDAGGTGLNLQIATVLINMDLPWNPAILEQRNARIHRLGQKNKVQIILMIAADSYEQRIFQLINSKQDLFDNVISPEANQDVVGITKKSLAIILDELNKKYDTKEIDNVEKSEYLNEEGLTITNEIATQELIVDNKIESTISTNISEKNSESNDELNKILTLLQQQFGSRIEQVLAKNSGLLIIVDQLGDQMENTINKLDTEFSIAIIDRRTQQQLAKLGLDDPIANAEPISLPVIKKQPSIWHQQARDKLNSAQFLFEHQQEGVIDLLSTSISACITELAEQIQLMSAEDVPVWLFSKGVPKQLITDNQATSMIKILSLKHAVSIPVELQQQALTNTKVLIEELCIVN